MMALPHPSLHLLAISARASSTATKTAPFPSPNSVSSRSVSFAKFKPRSSGPLGRWPCANKDSADDLFEGFSMLSPDIPWDSNIIWSTFAAYFFSLHIPLSFGGLSIVSQTLHQSVLDPLQMVISALVLQTVELIGALALIFYTAKPQFPLSKFRGMLLSDQRNWIKASALGIGFLIVLVLLTSVLADILLGPKDVNNPIIKDILLYSSTSKTACFFLYCLIAPLLEEAVYRGFLLSCLASKMKWQRAVVISSCLFSMSHFSAENSLQLFLVGCVLGSVYCWTGNLVASFTVHSVYNAMILLLAIVS